MPIEIERMIVAASGSRSKEAGPYTVTIPDGGVTLLLGREGSGKTTFLEAIAGLHEIRDGTVRYDGHQLWNGRRPNPVALRAFGIVLQQPEQQLFARTIREEFDFSLRFLKLSAAERKARSEEALAQVGLPTGILEESPFTLSGGQKRRLALACTFAARPDWLLLDEPSAGLDPESAELLVSYVRERDKRNGGVLIATHDAETFLPVADRVLFMRDGAIAADMLPAELAAQPEVWEEAQTGAPPGVLLAAGLRRLGVPVRGELPPPDELARLLTTHMARDRAAPLPVTEIPETKLPLSARAEQEPEDDNVPAASAFDPRAKWVLYVLLSAGVLLQRDWTGLSVAAALTVALALASKVSLRSMYPFLLPYGIFVLVSTLVSGIELGGSWSGNVPLIGGIRFSWSRASATLFSLIQMVPVMIAGIWFALTTGTRKMKRALDQSLGPLRRMRVPTEPFSLASSLLLRFIPVLLELSGRFVRIARARGKRALKGSATLPARDLPVMVLPMILSVFQLASDMALALESRGYKGFGGVRAPRAPLRLQRRDWLLMAGGALALFALALIPLLTL